MANLLAIYHSLPGWAQTIAAGLHGYRLKRWRYGRDFEALLREVVQREGWTPEKTRTWQQDRLLELLERAATRVPYYRDYWAGHGGGRAAWSELANWPLLDKEDVRSAPERFVADDCDRTRMYHEHTSGTSGKPIDLWWSAETVRLWYAMFEARWRLWNGVSRHDRWAILGGQIVTPVAKRRPPFWVWNAPLNQLYMSSYHLSPELIGFYLDALAKYRIEYLWGYTSSLYSLAQQALALGRKDLQMKVALANAEPVFAYQREAIGAAFGCPVRETYGMAEIVAAASECDRGRLHLWPDAGVVEVLEDALPVAAGQSGELVCTGLVNADMPLVRYRVGDRGALDEEHNPCECGRTWPRLKAIEGRDDDMLYTRDGRRIGRLDPVFKSRLPIREAQIVQDSLDLVRVRFVPAADYTEAAGRSIVERLRQRMGDIEIRLEPVEQIERTRNGKLRAVLCRIPPEQLKAIESQPPTLQEAGLRAVDHQG